MAVMIAATRDLVMTTGAKVAGLRQKPPASHVAPAQNMRGGAHPRRVSGPLDGAHWQPIDGAFVNAASRA